MRIRFLRSCVVACLLSAAEVAFAVDTPPPLPLVASLKISGVDVTLKTPPAHLVVRQSLGLITHEALDGQLIHRASGQDVVLETRATITPGGDYLLMFPEGAHYGGSKGRKVNRLVAYRSSDRGRTWSGPTEAFNINYSQHGFIPLIPRGTKRIYAFGTQPILGSYDFEHGQNENAPIGFRWSDDDGHTWSDVMLIRPLNDPNFKGMSVMRMTETDSGVWLLGSHSSDFSKHPLITRQYLLRSADRGQTWTVLPDAQPNGWFAAGFGRMDEGRPISIGGSKVLFMSRTTQGHLFTAWSDDDGLTWTPPAPSPLIHPDAPPMLFHLTDGKTLVAFHHNRVPLKEDGNLSAKSENMTVRSEIWVSISTDGGHTWTEPRFLLANAAVPDLENGWRNYQCSYLDAFADHGVLHLFMPHRWQQALHLTIAESALATLPTKAQLAAAAARRS
jgi:hypothetical protein